MSAAEVEAESEPKQQVVAVTSMPLFEHVAFVFTSTPTISGAAVLPGLDSHAS